MLAGNDTGGVVRLCKPTFDLALPVTVVTTRTPPRMSDAQSR